MRHVHALLKCMSVSNMTTRPLEHLVSLSVIASGKPDDAEEGKIVQMAWQTLSLSKKMVGINWNKHDTLSYLRNASLK